MNDHPEFEVARIEADAAPGAIVAVMYSCHRQWTELRATEQADVRFCTHCRQSVMQVRTPGGLLRAAAARACVHLAASDSRGPFVGEVKVVDYSATSRLNWDE
jgi:hypothetical protein